MPITDIDVIALIRRCKELHVLTDAARQQSGMVSLEVRALLKLHDAIAKEWQQRHRHVSDPVNRTFTPTDLNRG